MLTTTADKPHRQHRSAQLWVVLLRLVAGALALWALFVVLGEFVVRVWAHSRFGHDDASVEKYLAAHRTAAGNTVSLVLVDLADTITVIALTAVVVVALYLTRRRFREPLFLVAVVVGEVAIFVATTAVVDRPRPPVRHLDAAPPTSSFPSGHTAAAICLYGGIALLCAALLRPGLVRRLMWTIAVVVPVAVAAGRLYRGMHFPTDVLGGVLLGALWLSWVTRVYPLGKGAARAATTRA